MHNWKKTTLSDVANIRTGKLDSNKAVSTGRYPFFTCSPETFCIDTPAFDCEAVLLAGNNANGVFGVKYYKGEFNAYQRTYVITTKDNNTFNTRYLFYVIRELAAQLGQHSNGTATKFLTRQILDPWTIFLPTIDEQRAIARLLGALDDKIELNRQMNRTLEAMAQTLFKSWFVDFAPVTAKAEGRKPYGMDEETAALFPKAFEDSALGAIPEGWRIGKIGDIGQNIRSGIRPSNVLPDTPYIGLEHMPRKSITLAEWGQASDVTSGKSAFSKGDILFGKLRPYFHKVGVALIDGVCSTDVLVVRPSSQVWFGLLLGHLFSGEFINYVDAASGGTKMPRTDWETMARYGAVIPNEKISARLSQLVTKLIDKIHHNVEEINVLAALRDSLLPKLLSGEIPVRHAEKLVGEAG